MASYVYGNTVRKDVTVIQKPEKQPKEISQRVRKNRTKALHMSRGYVVFLAVAAMVALFACVKYLQLQSEVTNRSKHITAMQHELADLKESNTTRYNAIVNSMNLEEILGTIAGENCIFVCLRENVTPQAFMTRLKEKIPGLEG